MFFSLSLLMVFFDFFLGGGISFGCLLDWLVGFLCLVGFFPLDLSFLNLLMHLAFLASHSNELPERRIAGMILVSNYLLSASIFKRKVQEDAMG